MSDENLIPLSQIISVDNIPSELNIIQDGLENIFSKLFIYNFQAYVSTFEDYTSYDFNLVSFDRIAIGIFGEDGITLVLNPGIAEANSTEFPIYLRYSWPLLKLIENFNVEGFDFSAQAFFNIFLNIYPISDEQKLTALISVFFHWNEIHEHDDEPEEEEEEEEEEFDDRSPTEQFIDDFNLKFAPVTPLVIDELAADNEEVIKSLVDQLNSNGNEYDINQLVFQDYIFDTEPDVTSENLDKYLNFFGNSFSIDSLKEYLFPYVYASIENISLALEFPRSWLKPVDSEGNVIEDERSKLIYHVGSMDYDSKLGFEFNNIDSFDLDRSQIGNTGLLIEINNLKFDFRTDKNIPEADADGRPLEFQGIYTDMVAITLPKKWFNDVDNNTLQVVGRNLLIGTGGVSGTIALETLSGQPNDGANHLKLKVGNWEVGFNYFNIIFKQNVVTESNIAGYLKIPKLKDSQGNDAEIQITGHLNEAGDFNLTASEPEGIPLTLFDFVTFNFLTLELGRQNDKFYIGTSCQIWFENDIMKKLIGDQIIEIPNLRVYENGTIEIVGGNGFIPLNISLNLGPVEMSVTGVHYGSTQLKHGEHMRKYNYWGFDGAISIDPLGVDVRGDGIKYYYTTDNDDFGGDGDSFIHIKTLEIDLIIPGTASPESAVAIIHGMLSLPDPGESPEYIGEISLKLPQVKVAGGAAMKFQPRYPAFVVDTFIDLPAPIPIGPVGIYGFRGLLGYRYVATKEAVGLVSGEDSWYDYYVHDPRGIHVSKFSGPPESLEYSTPVALGAGAVIGTSFDSGTVISARVMMVLSLPTLFMIDGRASILSTRLGLDSTDEPPFFAFVAWGDDSIEMGMGADFKMPTSNGQILKLYAEIQSGFFFNAPSSWYVNFGTKETPIKIDILTLFQAQGYLMLSAQGIESGARLDFEIRETFGPARVYIYVYIEIGGYISFERPQIGGYVAAGGGIDVKIWVVGVSLSLDTIFSAEASKPFLIYSEVKFRACARLVVKVCKSFTVKIKWEKDKSVDRSPIPPLPSANQNGQTDRTKELVKGIHMLTNEVFELDYFDISTAPSPEQITKVIPVDTYIELKTIKSLLPGAVSSKIGGYTFAPENCVDLVPPKKIVRGGKELRQVKHRYSIEEIEIKAWDGSSWKNYHPFEAIVPPIERPNVANLRIGYWQIKEKQYDTVRLLATTPFTYLDAGEPGWHTPEMYGITPSVLYCKEPYRGKKCRDFLNLDIGAVFYPSLQNTTIPINDLHFSLVHLADDIKDIPVRQPLEEVLRITDTPNSFGHTRSLTFSNSNDLVVILPEAARKVELRLATQAGGVTIKYYKSVIDDTTSIVQHELIHQEYKRAPELNSVQEYQNPTHAISRIVIEPDKADRDTIRSVKEEIAELFETTYNEAVGEVNITEPSDVIQYEHLVAELETLTTVSCTEVTPECQSNPILCDFYEELLEIYNTWFLPVETSQQVDNNIWHFQQFLLIAERAALNVTDRDLNDAIVNYQTILDEIIINIRTEEQIERFHELIIYAQEIMDILNELGDCDCDSSPQQSCNTSVLQLCWESLEDQQWDESIPGSEAIEEDFGAMTDAVQQTVQPIWRPNTTYYIRFRLKDEVDNGDSDPGVYDYYYGFKTVGPLGHYHKNAASGYLPSEANADEYQLTSLRSYIDYNRSYPNADGNILKAKPLFYGNNQCRISVFFNKPMTYHMFQDWHEYDGLPELKGKLHIAIKDPVTEVIIPYPLPVNFYDETVPLPDGSNEWDDDNDPLLPPHIQLLNNIIQHAELPCEIDLGDPIAPKSSYYTVTLTNLNPLKLYTALLYNAFGVSNNQIVSEPVHEFVFQTSRYANFEQQVKSYLIQDEESQEERQAVFNIPLNLDQTSIGKAYDIIANPTNQTGDNLGAKYQHLFDRVVEGIFEITPLDPPVRTEFLKIINTNTQDVVALLIRNPEPFNIPKIPLDEVQQMITVMMTGGSSDLSYKVLYSNDYSQAIIMHSSHKITAGQLNFRFFYYMWNGNEYEIEDTITLQNIIINN